jgi:hypothetical protein
MFTKQLVPKTQTDGLAKLEIGIAQKLLNSTPGGVKNKT